MARKKPRNMCSCKACVVSVNQPIGYNQLTDSLLIMVWEIDSSIGIDTRWEIRFTNKLWNLDCREYGCEKQMIKRKILFFIPQTKFVYEPFVRARSFSFQQPITQVLQRVDSLSSIVANSKANSRHFVRFEYFTPGLKRVFEADVLNDSSALAKLLTIFERDAIILNDK